MATQADRIYLILARAADRGQWVCGTVFLEQYMPRYSAAIWTLRHKKGLLIEERVCEQHPERPAHMVGEFRLKSIPVAPSQLSWT